MTKQNTGHTPPVAIAFSCDTSYAPHTGTALLSLLLHTNPNRSYKISILDGGIEQEDKDKLTSLLEPYPHASLKFIAMGDAFDFVSRHQGYGPANYYRLKLPSLLGDDDKVLYLDSDLIVLRDVAHLFDTDLADHAVGACPDLGMKVAMHEPGRRTGGIVGELPIQEYYRDYVGMKPETFDSYFNSGVLLMNLKKLRDEDYEARFMDVLYEKEGRFWFVDQDMFNGFFQADYKELDWAWNMQTWSLDWAEQLPQEVHAKFITARSNPHIVHFIAKFNKPWNFPQVDFADLYWEYRQRTPWGDKGKPRPSL